MPWLPRFSGFPTLTHLIASDTYVSGVFAFSSTRRWGVYGSEVPHAGERQTSIAYEYLTDIGVDVTTALRITATFESYTGADDVVVGAGVGLFGGNEWTYPYESAYLIYASISAPISLPGGGTAVQHVLKNGVLQSYNFGNIYSESLLSAPPIMMRIYYNGKTESYDVVDSGLEHILPTKQASLWFSVNSGTSWTQINPNFPFPDTTEAATKVVIFPIGVGTGGPIVTFSSFEIDEEEAPADAEYPVVPDISIQTSGYEDGPVAFPSLSGPQKYQYPEDVAGGVGQRVPGPVDQSTKNVDKVGPFDYSGFEDGPVTIPTVGGPVKYTAPSGSGLGMGIILPGPADQQMQGGTLRRPANYAGIEDDAVHILSSGPEIRPDTFDDQGHPHLTGYNFWVSYYYDATKTGEYWNTPTLNSFTGYAKDGKHYNAGVEDGGPVWAPWAIESPSDHRSSRTDFPDQALIVIGNIDVVIFDLDGFDGTIATLRVWMRFLVDSAVTTFRSLGRGQFSVRDAKMCNGVLVVGTQHNGTENGAVFCIDFKVSGQGVYSFLRADGRWQALAGKTIVHRNDSGGLYEQVTSNLHIDSEYIYRVDAYSDTTDSLYVAHVGEDIEDPQVSYFTQNVFQSRARNYGDDLGEYNLYDYDYKSIIFDDAGWLWYARENKLFRGVRYYRYGNVLSDSHSPLIKRIELPEDIYWLAAARDYIYAIGDTGIWQIHRGTMEFHLAYTVQGDAGIVKGGGKDNTPPDGELVKGGRISSRIHRVYALSLSLSSYLGVAVKYDIGGGATIIRLYDDLVLDSFEHPELAEDGSLFVVPVPV